MKHYIRELELRSEKAEHTSQLKSECLANMSHELRSPLQNIMGFAELLAEESCGALNERQKLFVDHILRESTHLIQLTNDLLDLSRIEAGRLDLELEALHSGVVLDDAVISIQRVAASKSVEIRRGDRTPHSVFADRLRLEQILRNLLSNAVKFTPAGGHIFVDTAARDGFAEISVADTGIGIAESLHQTVFDRFYQVKTIQKGLRQGTGLGLTITRRLVEQHGGRIWLTSAPGAGSCFTFTIPLHHARVD